MISPDLARRIIAELPPFVTPTGIFVEQTPEEINSICRYTGVQVAQLHSDSYSPSQALAVTSARVVRVFRPGPEFRIEEVRKFARETRVNGFLFDAYSPEMAGGTGETIESSIAMRLIEETRSFAWAILAGGLNPGNVGAAVRHLRPWGVDTASGVESAPGIKDHIRIRAFVEAIREADRQITSFS
jgi:phosphoribosylanthranilate isomerase